ncbi:hypothetical protein POTOM_010089 [Populus tomentosa]|uniref:Uncharacterized protein n=1 Tax=Populus tomentosa TaxID=118781 RepID=A0A8X8AD74_POPTO|nr:hypothetical protein POTOM_010089 [Populus tomentosa]
MQYVRDAANFVSLSTEGYGLALRVAGDLAISLGTRDTAFGIASDPQPGLEGHISPDPVDAEGYMVLLVYKNGSLPKEDVRTKYAEKSWAVFNKFLQKTPPLNGFHRSSQRFGMPSPPQRITATGGASANHSILNSRASIFGGDVRTKTWSPAFAFTSFSYSGFSELDSSPDGCENLFRAICEPVRGQLGEFVPLLKLSVSAGNQQLVSRYALLMKKEWK